MKLRGSLACLLLTLCLGGGAASPLQNGGEGAGAGASQGMGDAISHGVGEAVGEGAKEAASSGIQDALGQGHGEEGGYALRGARGDAFDHRLGEAARSLGNAGNEVGRQAEDVIRRGIDAARNSGSWGTSGGHGMFGSQGGVGGHGNPGGQGTPWASEGNFGTNSLGGSLGQGGDGRSFNYEANAQGAVAQPGYGAPTPHHLALAKATLGEAAAVVAMTAAVAAIKVAAVAIVTAAVATAAVVTVTVAKAMVAKATEAAAVAVLGPGKWRHLILMKAIQSPGEVAHPRAAEAEVVVETNPSVTTQGMMCARPEDLGIRKVEKAAGSLGVPMTTRSMGPVGKEDAMRLSVASKPCFWENFKSKMGFINWDAINKGRLPPPSTRALLYFRRLWENFKRNTPFFNWKQIEGSDLSSLQKRAGGADQFSQAEAARQEVSAVTAKSYYNSQQGSPGYNWQYYAKTTAKGGVSPSSSASRAQPGLLKWLKFW